MKINLLVLALLLGVAQAKEADYGHEFKCVWSSSGRDEFGKG